MKQKLYFQAAYFFALFPYVVLLTLMVKGLTLPGAYDGIIFFLTPTWSDVFTIQTWFHALSQLFFSLGICYGQVVNYASYNEFRHDVYKDGLILSCVDTFTSILAGVTIFSILGNLAKVSGHPVSEVGNKMILNPYKQIVSFEERFSLLEIID